jgi:hypothetical protein
MNRRTALKRAGALAVALGALEAVGPFSFAPVRVGASIVPSDIQFDIYAFLPVPPQNYGTDVQFQLPPVHTVFLTAALERTPTRADQAEMNGGGPALLPDENRRPRYAERTAQGIGTAGRKRRMGHLSCLQRTSRAADGTPLHIRMDGPGFDAMDVPGGGNLPKLQFTIFVPSAEFFRTLRTSQASLDLQEKYGVAVEDNGLERFLTATRRQNFLVPPRRHRAFP